MKLMIMKIKFNYLKQKELLTYLVYNKFDSSGFKLNYDFNYAFENIKDIKCNFLILRRKK